MRSHSCNSLFKKNLLNLWSFSYFGSALLFVPCNIFFLVCNEFNAK